MLIFMKIYLIRHGETTGDLEDRYGGDYDDHLSSRGINQVQELGNKLKDRNIQMIYHSSRIRATETAKIVSDIINSPIIKIGDIRERNAYGIFTGMTKEEARKQFPEEVEKLQKNSLYHDIRNSEDYDSFKERIVSAFKDIIFNSEFESIAIISHGGSIRCFIREFLKLGELKMLGDCAILELENKDNELALISLDNAELKN
jgi:broad specificity phosphatase PhoE